MSTLISSGLVLLLTVVLAGAAAARGQDQALGAASGSTMTSSSLVDRASEFMPADVYPSRRRAVAALVGQLAREVELAGKNFGEVCGGPESGNSATDPQVGEALMEALREQFPGSRVFTAVQDEKAEDRLTFAVVESDVRPGPAAALASSGGKARTATGTVSEPYSGESGRISVHMSAACGLTGTATARFVEKPWADDWNRFRNERSDRRFLHAQSTQMFGTESEALANARDVAVDQLTPLMKATMNANAARSQSVIKVSDDWVRDRLRSSVERNVSNKVVPDRFVQKFPRPYGDLWRASLLVNASQDLLSELNTNYNAVAAAQRKTTTTSFAAIGGLGVVIVLLYAFLNMATRGYFTWRLRAAAVTMMIVAALVVLRSL